MVDAARLPFVRTRGVVLLVCACVAAVAWWIFRDKTPEGRDLSKLSSEQWHDDLRFLAQELARKHANAFNHTSRADFDRLVAVVDQSINDSDWIDIPVNFSKLTAAVGDAHTYVQLPSSKARYPLRLYWFGHDLRVIRATAPAEGALGLRLQAINGIALPELTSRLKQISPRNENDWYFMEVSPFWLIKPEVLHALGIASEREHARFSFLRDEGEIIELTLAPVAEEARKWREAYDSPPPYLEHQTDPFWVANLSGGKVIYVIFNSYDWLFFRARKLFRDLDQHPDSKLVIDLRNNRGGDYHVGHWSLIKPILRRPSLNRKDRLFVVTGRGTFSAAMNNAAQFHVETNATLVGEPPGEVPNGYQEKRAFYLPNSHLQINYSARYYRFLPDDPRALIPDESVDPNWDDYRAGIDPVLKRLAPE